MSHRGDIIRKRYLMLNDRFGSTVRILIIIFNGSYWLTAATLAHEQPKHLTIYSKITIKASTNA